MFRSTPSKASSDAHDTVEELTNQTHFSSEEPLFENPPLVSSSPSETVDPGQKKKFPPLLVLGGGVVGLILIVLLVVVVLFPRRQSTPISVETAAEIAEQSDSSELTRRLSELESDLKAADPVKVDLPFPPVNLSIYLDEPQR